MTLLMAYWDALVARLNGAGNYVTGLALRLILFWEYLESGLEKLNGSNWFSNIQSDFPFPFDIIPPDFSWFIATWFEIVGAFALLLGLFTRFFSIQLIVLTVVATAAVHWPSEWSSLSELWKGYAISDKGFGNFKLPLLYFLMFLPLLFNGPGKFSLDHLLTKWFRGARVAGAVIEDRFTVAWAILAIGLPLVFVLPGLAIVSLLIGTGFIFWGRASRV